MFVTEPLCKTLGTYIPSRARNRTLDRMGGVHDEGGIPVAHLLSTLQHHRKDAIEQYNRLAQGLRDAVSKTP